MKQTKPMRTKTKLLTTIWLFINAIVFGALSGQAVARGGTIYYQPVPGIMANTAETTITDSRLTVQCAPDLYNYPTLEVLAIQYVPLDPNWAPLASTMTVKRASNPTAILAVNALVPKTNTPAVVEYPTDLPHYTVMPSNARLFSYYSGTAPGVRTTSVYTVMFNPTNGNGIDSLYINIMCVSDSPGISKPAYISSYVGNISGAYWFTPYLYY